MPSKKGEKQDRTNLFAGKRAFPQRTSISLKHSKCLFSLACCNRLGVSFLFLVTSSMFVLPLPKSHYFTIQMMLVWRSHDKKKKLLHVVYWVYIISSSGGLTGCSNSSWDVFYQFFITIFLEYVFKKPHLCIFLALNLLQLIPFYFVCRYICLRTVHLFFTGRLPVCTLLSFQYVDAVCVRICLIKKRQKLALTKDTLCSAFLQLTGSFHSTRSCCYGTEPASVKK